MRSAVVMFVQILITLAVVGVAMPVLFAYVPTTRDSAVGPCVLVGLGVLTFVVLRIVWPKARA